MFTLKPVARLLAVKGNEANLDFAYTDGSIKDHIQVAFEGGAELVVVRWKGDLYHCTKAEQGWKREYVESSPYQEYLEV